MTANQSGTQQLAIDGGTPARRRPDPPMFPGGNMIGEEEEQAVLNVLRSKRLFRYYGPTPGESQVEALEKAFAAHMGTSHAVAVSSGTGSLICALAGVGVGPGDEVIVPAYTWIASASAVVLSGAIPVIAEVDESLTLDPADVERKITPRTKAILPVHMRGAPACMTDLQQVARSHDLRIVEDVAQANGASFQGKRLGSIGDVGCFSLQFNKIITCGEGGMVITSDDQVHKRALMMHDVVGGSRNNITPEETMVGMNFRMPELSGAVALAQLGRLDGLLNAMRERKSRLKAGIADALQAAGGSFRRMNDEAGDAAISMILFMPTVEKADWVIKALRAENIGASGMFKPDRSDYHVYPHWTPIMAQRTWSEQGGPWQWGAPITYTPDMCPRSNDLLGRAVHVDINPLLELDEIDESIAGFNKVLAAVAQR